MTLRTLIQTAGVMPRAGDRAPSIVLLAAVVIVAAHRALAVADMPTCLWSGYSQHDGVTAMFLALFVMLGIVPAAIVRGVFREPLRSYGVRIGDWRAGAIAVGVLLPVIAVVLLWPGAHTPAMRAFHPLDRDALRSTGALLRYETLHVTLFYAPWEFFFRGFMLFGLRRTTGDWLAVCIQTLPSCLWHVGMPLGELFTSIAGGIVFGLLALRTRSIAWPFALHALIGIVTDCFIAAT